MVSAMIVSMKIGKQEGFTLTEASAKTGLSVNTLRAQIRNGVLPATLVGKTWFVLDKDLATYERDHKGKPGRPRNDAPKVRRPPKRKPAPPTNGDAE